MKTLTLDYFLVITLCLALSTSASLAETRTKQPSPITRARGLHPLPEAASSILYTARIPSQVTRFRPHKAITRFYGRASIQGQQLAFHFYDLQPLQKINQDVFRRKSRLDVFEVKESDGSIHFRRIKTVPVEHDGWREQKLLYQMVWMWLDPAQKTIPILMVRRTNRSEYGGFDGADFLFTFSQGFSKTPSTNIFGRGRVDEGFTSWNTEYGPIDKNGYLTVLEINTQGGDRDYAAYTWDGQKLALHQEQKDIFSNPTTYRWDGNTFVESDPRKPAPTPQETQPN